MKQSTSAQYVASIYQSMTFRSYRQHQTTSKTSKPTQRNALEMLTERS